MKIPPASTATPPPTNANANARPATDVNKTSVPKRVAGAETKADEHGESAGAAGRDFASVLEEVARPRERDSGGGDDGGDGDSQDAQMRDRAEAEPEARRRDGRDERDGGSGDGRGGGSDPRGGGVREVTAAREAVGARSILHIADIERIVSTVRTQTLAGGVREVTLELRRSVLDGLRVKISLDGGGRVAAEFIAASERVRAQLDARSSELAEILRSRGINLASLRTTVSADASGHDSPGGGRGFAPQAGEGAARLHGTPAAAPEPAEDPAAADDASGTTYRA